MAARAPHLAALEAFSPVETAMRKLTQRLSVLIVAWLSAFTLFAAAQGAWTLVASARASPGTPIVSAQVDEPRRTIWDEGVRPTGVAKAESH
jgi:hypothetical protein